MATPCRKDYGRYKKSLGHQVFITMEVARRSQGRASSSSSSSSTSSTPSTPSSSSKRLKMSVEDQDVPENQSFGQRGSLNGA